MRRWAWCLSACFGAAAWFAHAQERDPTQPPVQAGVATVAGSLPQAPWGTQGMAVMMRNGQPFLVVDTRLYAVGQTVGGMRIERITETEIWLREGTVVRKIPRFTGIQRSDALAEAPKAAASVPRSKDGKASTMMKKATAP